MDFKPSDYVWDDWAGGLTPERAQRYEFVMAAIADGLEPILQRHYKKWLRHICATTYPGLFATGVRGDNRVYAPVVMLYYQRWPGYAWLGRVAQDITDTLPVSRVIATSFKGVPIP